MTPLNPEAHHALVALVEHQLPVDRMFSRYRSLLQSDELQKDMKLLVEAGIIKHLGTEANTLRDVFTFTELGKKLYLLLRD